MKIKSYELLLVPTRWLKPFRTMFIEEPVLPENNETLREIANQ